jgi:hypothetical protein
MDEKTNVEMNEKQSTEQVERPSVHRSISGHSGKTDEKPINLKTREINQKLANPLAGRSHERLMAEGEAFAKNFGMEDLTDEFRKGAVVAQDPLAFESLGMLSEDDKINLRREIEHKWDQPIRLYLLVICCSVAAAVQGVSTLYVKSNEY